MEVTKPSRPWIELQWWHHAVIFLCACAVVISRQPDAVFHAQFWAEDGHVWYADAYNLGWWQSLFRVFEGYVEIFPRLGAALALLAPLQSAPLVLNIIAICVHALPVVILLSRRSSVWGSLPHRAWMAGIYLVLPNTGELNSTITNSQWFLALSLFLILVASEPRSVWARAFDLCILLLCAFSGPFCIFLLPIAAFLAWRHRSHRYWLEIGVLAVGCVVQAHHLINGGYTGRFQGSLGASPTRLFRLVASQFYIGALLGPNGLAAKPGTLVLIILVGAILIGSVLLAICLIRSPLPMKLFFVFAFCVLGASLNAPLLSSNLASSPWEILALGGGTRYWYFPCLGLAWMIVWSYYLQATLARRLSAVLLCVFCVGVVLHWRNGPLQDMHFDDFARRFESAPTGTEMTIPLNPSGWDIQLIKRQPK